MQTFKVLHWRLAGSADLTITTMKRLSTITAATTASLLLAGCQSKRDICLEYLANPRPDGYESLEHVSDYWQRLGINAEFPDNYNDGFDGIEAFCENQKS